MTSMTAKIAPLFAFMVALILFPCDAVAGKGKNCYDFVDIVHVQDVTSSFRPYWPGLVANVSKAVTLVKTNLTDAHFGIASFGDKPISGTNPTTGAAVTLGATTDYCLHVDQPLQIPDAPRAVQVLQGLQNRAVGNGDAPANVFEAVYRAIIAAKLAWRPDIPPSADAKIVGRFVILVTASVPHLQGDVLKLTGRAVRPFDLTPLKLRNNRDNENYDCASIEYPTVKQMGELIPCPKNTTLIVLVGPSGTTDAQGVFHPHESVVALGEGYQSKFGLLLWYRKQLYEAGLFQVHVRQLDTEATAYYELIENIVNGHYVNICGKPPATAAARAGPPGPPIVHPPPEVVQTGQKAPQSGQAAGQTGQGAGQIGQGAGQTAQRSNTDRGTDL